MGDRHANEDAKDRGRTPTSFRYTHPPKPHFHLGHGTNVTPSNPSNTLETTREHSEHTIYHPKLHSNTLETYVEVSYFSDVSPEKKTPHNLTPSFRQDPNNVSNSTQELPRDKRMQSKVTDLTLTSNISHQII